MILPFPQTVDSNEWFIMITGISAFGLVLFLPRRFAPTISFLVMALSYFIANVLDHILAAPPFDYYDVGDKKEFEVFDQLTYMLYAPFGYLFVYLYDRWNIQGYQNLIYIIGWSLFAVGFEWLAASFHLFQYKNWLLIQSFSIYLLVQGITLFFYLFAQKQLSQLKQTMEHKKG